MLHSFCCLKVFYHQRFSDVNHWLRTINNIHIDIFNNMHSFWKALLDLHNRPPPLPNIPAWERKEKCNVVFYLWDGLVDVLCPHLGFLSPIPAPCYQQSVLLCTVVTYGQNLLPFLSALISASRSTHLCIFRLYNASSPASPQMLTQLSSFSFTSVTHYRQVKAW